MSDAIVAMSSRPTAASPLPTVVTLDRVGLAQLCVDMGQAAYRASQLADAVWRPELAGFEDIHQLPVALRDSMVERLRWSAVDVIHSVEADAGLTVKLLCRLHDGQTVETVVMETPQSPRGRRRATVCVSSQVGCAVGCPFCATGQMGLRRNCSTAEIVDQVRAAARVLHQRGLGPVTHVVYMGMGEPLANYGPVIHSLRLLTGPAGIGARRITVSTSGVVPAIDRLAGEGLPITLAISLHAANDHSRDRLVPLNRTHNIASLTAAGSRFASATGRRVSYEWCLIGGVNDSPTDAAQLRALARASRAHVNVIPMNHVEGSPWGPPDVPTTERFLANLQGVRHTRRDTRGSETDAACGQLRAGLERRRTVMPDGTLSAPSRSRGSR